MSGSGILCHLHCKTCLTKRGRKGRYEIGLANPFTLRVWCKTCDQLICDLRIDPPMALRCDVCGEPVTPDHHH
jgi:hypothetical protein